MASREPRRGVVAYDHRLIDTADGLGLPVECPP
jgi:hypothetical protein